MAKPITFGYSYKFKSGLTKKFVMNLDRDTLNLILDRRPDPPLWALLNHKKCENCPLDVKTHAYCPVALNFVDIAEQFKDMVSHEEVLVTVTVEERLYAAETTIQQGLSPLIGIIMATSGCPVLDHLRPMVRFHLPFASLDETVFRMVSMYLLVQYYRNQDGNKAEWRLDGLTKVYAAVGMVNRDFANRLRDAAKKDANLNALVNLDCFASMVPLVADDTLKAIKPYFSAYLQ
jgi:uncharacterized protein DUF6901